MTPFARVVGTGREPKGGLSLPILPPTHSWSFPTTNHGQFDMASTRGEIVSREPENATGSV